jgi:catechol 2,3-dioxygenase-like lactoylglutathione lyase family enzyme
LFSRGLREVVLIVDDVEASTAFYRDVVGLELQPQQTSDWAWFYVGDPERCQRLGIEQGDVAVREPARRVCCTGSGEPVFSRPTPTKAS